jgi:hypothetical protein
LPLYLFLIRKFVLVQTFHQACSTAVSFPPHASLFSPIAANPLCSFCLSPRVWPQYQEFQTSAIGALP